MATRIGDEQVMESAIQLHTLDIELDGLSPLLFQRYEGNEKNPDPKGMLYLTADGHLSIPSSNIEEFFSSETGAVSRFGGSASKKELIPATRGGITVAPEEILIMRDGEVLPPPDLDLMFVPPGDPATGLCVIERKANVKKSGLIIPQIRRRPRLPLPWSIRFQIKLVEYQGIPFTVRDVSRWLVRGGLEVGLCAFRPRYGKFRLAKFEKTGSVML